MRALAWWGAAAAAVASLGLGAFLTWGPPVPVRLTLGDGEYLVSSPSDPLLAEAVHLRSQALLTATVTLRADDEIRRVPVAELGYSVDERAFWEEARATVELGQKDEPSSWSGRLVQRLVRRPRHAAVFVPLQLDLEIARQTLQRLAREIDRKPLDAELSIEEHKIHPSEPGRRLSVESSLIRLSRVALERDVVIETDVEILAPEITESDLVPVDVTKVLSSYETSFRGKAGSRAVNIRSAARYLDGAVILPGEQLSFNARVGRRVHGRGFVDAPVIVNDELEQDVGGGVCQVATTLHAAAVFGNLRVVSRRSHSRPSGYAPLGLDATVIDGEVDLKLENPYDEPLLVHAWVNGPYSVRVEILGREPNARVSHAYSVTSREPFARRIWFKEAVADGAFERKQKGSAGMDVVSVLRIEHADGRSERRSYHSKYYPVPEVFWIGKRVDVAALPQLPEGATGVVIDGREVGLAPDVHAPRPTDVPRLDEVDGTGHRG